MPARALALCNRAPKRRKHGAQTSSLPKKGRLRSRENRSSTPTRRRTLTCGTRRERPASTSSRGRRRSAILCCSGDVHTRCPGTCWSKLLEARYPADWPKPLDREARGVRKGRSNPVPKHLAPRPARAPRGSCRNRAPAKAGTSPHRRAGPDTLRRRSRTEQLPTSGSRKPATRRAGSSMREMRARVSLERRSERRSVALLRAGAPTRARVANPPMSKRLPPLPGGSVSCLP